MKIRLSGAILLLAASASGAAESSRWLFDAGYTRDRITNSRGEEYGTHAQIAHRLDSENVFWMRHEEQKRYGTFDQTLQAGGLYRARPDLLLLLSGGFTPQPDFRPKRQASAGAEYAFPRILTVLLDTRYLRYGSHAALQWVPGLRVEPASWAKVVYRYTVSDYAGRSTAKMFTLRLDLFEEETLSPYIGYTHGREDLPPEPSAKLTVYTGGCRWNVNPTLSVRADISYETRERYERYSQGLGLSVNF